MLRERVEAYFGKLEKLSGDDLDRSAQALVAIEKKDTARLIAHIAEIKSREHLAVELGYTDLFDYCVRRLNLSHGAVWRRIQVANICRQFPQILVALCENRLHLTAASVLAPHLNEENVEWLLLEAEGKSKRQLQELLVTLQPKEEFRPSVRKVARSEDTDATKTCRDSPIRDQATPRPRPIVEAATAESYNFRFCAGKDFKAKLERLAELIGVEQLHRHIEEVLETAVEIALEKKDPQRKLERRRKREAKAERERGFRAHDVRNRSRPEVQTVATSSRPGKTGREREAAPETSRYIPAVVRERVLERAGYQCEYHSPDGTRCRQRTRLEIDHERPFALYRTHDERYLRALCRQHNQLSAEKVYGSQFVREKIEDRRRRKVPTATVPAT